MIIIISLFVVLLIVITTQTLWLHHKPYQDILNMVYSDNTDIWCKKEGNQNLLIILHGMYSCPSSFQECAEEITKHGWDVYIPALPNSASSTEELMNQADFQWEDSLRVAFYKTILHTHQYKKTALCGHSQGGSLALSMAPTFHFLKGLIIVAAPLKLIQPNYGWIKNIGIALSGILYFLIPTHGISVKSKHSAEKSFYYGITLHSMNLALRTTRKNLVKIITPSLLVYEKGDKIVGIQDFYQLKKSISSSKITEVIFDTDDASQHAKHQLFNYEQTKEALYKHIIKFLKTL